MMELVANDMEDKHVIQTTTEDLISLYNIQKQGINNCGFERMCPMDINDFSCMFEFTVNNSKQGNTNGETMDQPMAMEKIITKRCLMELSIQAIHHHVSNIGDVEHINPNGLVLSI